MTPESRPVVWYDEETRTIYHHPHEAPAGATLYVSRPIAKAERDALVMGMMYHVLSTDLEAHQKRPESRKLRILRLANVGVLAGQLVAAVVLVRVYATEGVPAHMVFGMGILGMGIGMALTGLLNWRLIERAFTVSNRVAGHLEATKAKLDEFDPFEPMVRTKH